MPRLVLHDKYRLVDIEYGGKDGKDKGKLWPECKKSIVIDLFMKLKGLEALLLRLQWGASMEQFVKFDDFPEFGDFTALYGKTFYMAKKHVTLIKEFTKTFFRRELDGYELIGPFQREML